jgi:hypothetical protein
MEAGRASIPPQGSLGHNRTLTSRSQGVADVYGLPKDFDASFFVGGVLETVTFAINAIHLTFDTGTAVTVQKHVRYRVSSNEPLRDDVLPTLESGLMALVGRRVESTALRLPGDLILEFERGGTLLVEDDSEGYESYSMNTPDGEIFV